jgi:hypothetical protein
MHNVFSGDTMGSLSNPLLILSRGKVVMERCTVSNNQNLIGNAGLIGEAMNSLNLTSCVFSKNELLVIK